MPLDARLPYFYVLKIILKNYLKFINQFNKSQTENTKISSTKYVIVNVFRLHG